ncbi:hypothetical protein B0H13DRAFT_2134201 [Mycena leptocephala]|nr:hypothetical protein B0H13DRAFT_2134201 [Mycena leptocephala]
MLMGVGVPLYRALVVVLPVPARTSEASTSGLDFSATATSNESQANPHNPHPPHPPHAEVDPPIEIPATLPALVLVVYLAPALDPLPKPSPIEDEDPNDTTVSLDAPPPPLDPTPAAVSVSLDGVAAPRLPPRLPPALSPLPLL